MSYQVLARKWRPHNFQQVVGQQHVLTALVNALDQNRLHHAYLLSGTRGVGKTTIARILAKSLNCEKGITSTPCGECSTCVEIDQGSYVDLLEIDAASRTKVEDTRELLDNVQYKPARGRFKVYLIDEVHMLSKHSFNALLKTLEEPPEYVKFLLATTDPQKLPITILSRCLQFHLKCLTTEQICQQLVHILSREHCQYELSALNAIAKAADGSMRDALSLTDQALSFGAGEVRQQAVLDMLGTLDHSHMIQLLSLLVAGDANACMAKIAEVSTLGADFDQLHVELASLLHQIAMAQILPSSAMGSEYAEQINTLATQLAPEDVQLYYQICLTGRKELPLAPEPRSALEMTVLRMLAFRPQGRLAAPQADLQSTLSQQALPQQAQQQQQAQDMVSAETVVLEPVVQDAFPQENTVMGNPDSEQVQQLASLNIEQDELLQAAAAQGMAVEQTSVAVLADSLAINQPLQNTASESAAVNSAVDADVSSVEQGRKTRNFLRSRLGSSAKKSTATKSEQAPSSHYQPPKRPLNSVTSQSVNTQLANAPSYASQQDAPVRSDLPPLDSYQDNQYSYDGQDAGYQPDYQSVNGYQNQYQGQSQASAGRETAPAPVQRQIDRFSQVNVDINDLAPAFQQHKSVATTEHSPLDNKLSDESDTWCRYINQMHLGGRVRQMALHSVMVEEPGKVILTMNPDQRYFVNDKSRQQLMDALALVVAEPVELQINFGTDSERSTPAQIEDKIYQQRLANATKNLYDDKYIQFFINRLGAVVDDTSIVPV